MAPSVGADRDADARADDHLMTVDLVGFAHHVDDAACQHARIRDIRNGRLQNGEFVAAHARDGVGLAHQLAQALADGFEQLVACGMAHRVVDVLEVVEIEEMGRHHLSALGARQGVVQPLVEQYPVRQAGQGIVQRHVHDLGFRAALLGDVLVRRDDEAVAHRLAGHDDVAAIAHARGVLALAGRAHAAEHGAHHLVGASALQLAVGDALLDDVAQVGAWLHLVRCQVVERRIASVGDDDAHVGIEHGQPLHHVVERHIELDVLRLEPLFLLLHQAMLLLELGVELLTRRYVLVRDDMAAVGHAPVGDVDHPPVGQPVGIRRQIPQPVDQRVDEGACLVVAVCKPVFENLPYGRPRLHLLRREPVHFTVELIAHDQPLLAVEHGETLPHVVQGGIQLVVLFLQLLLQALLLGNIVQRHDPAAIDPGLDRGRNQAPVARGDQMAGVAARYVLPQSAQHLVHRHVAIEALCSAPFDDLAQRGTRPCLLGR